MITEEETPGAGLYLLLASAHTHLVHMASFTSTLYLHSRALTTNFHSHNTVCPLIPSLKPMQHPHSQGGNHTQTRTLKGTLPVLKLAVQFFTKNTHQFPTYIPTPGAQISIRCLADPSRAAHQHLTTSKHPRSHTFA